MQRISLQIHVDQCEPYKNLLKLRLAAQQSHNSDSESDAEVKIFPLPNPPLTLPTSQSQLPPPVNIYARQRKFAVSQIEAFFSSDHSQTSLGSILGNTPLTPPSLNFALPPLSSAQNVFSSLNAHAPFTPVEVTLLYVSSYLFLFSYRLPNSDPWQLRSHQQQFSRTRPCPHFTLPPAKPPSQTLQVFSRTLNWDLSHPAFFPHLFSFNSSTTLIWTIFCNRTCSPRCPPPSTYLLRLHNRAFPSFWCRRRIPSRAWPHWSDPLLKNRYSTLLVCMCVLFLTFFDSNICSNQISLPHWLPNHPLKLVYIRYPRAESRFLAAPSPKVFHQNRRILIHLEPVAPLVPFPFCQIDLYLSLLLFLRFALPTPVPFLLLFATPSPFPFLLLAYSKPSSQFWSTRLAPVKCYIIRFLCGSESQTFYVYREPQYLFKVLFRNPFPSIFIQIRVCCYVDSLRYSVNKFVKIEIRRIHKDIRMGTDWNHRKLISVGNWRKLLFSRDWLSAKLHVIPICPSFICHTVSATFIRFKSRREDRNYFRMVTLVFCLFWTFSFSQSSSARLFYSFFLSPPPFANGKTDQRTLTSLLNRYV